MLSKIDELKRTLEELQKRTGSIPFSMLYSLSDLAGQRWAEFDAAWSTFSTELRRRLIQALVELAEASFEVYFEPIFRHCLGDPDEQVRAMAIDGLWESEDPALIGPLLVMLRSDPSPQVRAAAAKGLGHYVLAGELEELAQPIQARIVTELLTTIHTPAEEIEVRRRAVESVAYAAVPEVLEMLEMAYYDDDEQMRISAVTGMGRSCDRRWKDILAAELQSDSPAMRYEAAWACGELALHQVVPTLARLIHDPDAQVRNATIWALGQIGGPRAKEILLEAYEESTDEDTLNAIDEALAEQALFEGEFDFPLYEFSEDLDDGLFEDEYTSPWDADEEEDDEFDEGWESEEL